MQTSAERPYWEQGNLAPVGVEITAFDLEVEGSIPPELVGLYARNGANPRQGHSGHWFLGDGMVHGVSLRNGKAEWYRNRWVRTRPLQGEPRSPEKRLDLRFGTANTNVIKHAGKIFALVENNLPIEVSRELRTVGYHDFAGKLSTSFTAHPKVCPTTGEIHFIGYSSQPPYLTYHLADKEGRLVRSLEIGVKAATMIHDLAITTGHVIFMDLPVVFDQQMALRGTMPFSWSDNYGARLGLLPRDGSTIRWVEIDPCYVYHVANAYEQADGTIILDVAWYEKHWVGGPRNDMFEPAYLKRWRIPPGATRAIEEQLAGHAIEFPRVSDSNIGLPHRYVYAVDTAANLGSDGFDTIRKYDVVSSTDTAHQFEKGLPSEFVHVPASTRVVEEDDGWLMGFVFDRARNASDLIILDAKKIESKPVARVKLPGRVPQGFHGSWMPDEIPA